MCRGKIYNRNGYSRNVLISCILEQKGKVKECKVHHRPLEFFCKDHKQLACVDCAIEGNHFAHNFLRSKEVDNRAEKIKVLMKKVDAKDEQSAKRFKAFLEQEKKDIKRKLDNVLDEYLEPLILIKKKLHKEVDTFMMSKSNIYEKETLREMIMKWKKDNEGIVSQWESKGEADAASQIAENNTEEIETKLGEYDSQMEKMQNETQGSTDILIKDIKSRMSHARGPWTKLKRRLGQIMNSFKDETNPKIEREYLIEFLKEYGILADWNEKDGEEILEVKKDNAEMVIKEFDAKYFDCTLEKLKIKIEQIHAVRLEIICKAFEKILKLSDLSVTLKDITDEGMNKFGDSLEKIKGIVKISVMIASEQLSERGLHKLITVLPALDKLEKLEIALEDCEELKNNEIEGLENAFEKLRTVKEFGIILNDCDSLTNEGLGKYIKCMNKLIHLTKLNLTVRDCKGLTYKLFEPLCKVLTTLKDLDELTLIFEGFYELSNPIMIISLASSIAGLSKLTKLRLSFTENVYLPSYIVRKFIGKITSQLPQLKELSLDLSRCKEIVNITLEAIGVSLTQLPHLNKLALRFRMCSISEKGVLALSSSLQKLNTLKTLTLDCRHCKLMDEGAQAKVVEELNKMKKLTEKELLFGPDFSLDALDSQTHIFSPHSHHQIESLWSPLERQITSREGAMLDVDFDESSFGLEDLYDSFGVLEENDLEGEIDESAIVDDDYAMMSIHSSDISNFDFE